MPDLAPRRPPPLPPLPPRRSQDTRPASPIFPPDDHRRRSSSDATPKQSWTPIHTESIVARPSKSNLSSATNAANHAQSSTSGGAGSGLYPTSLRASSRADNYPSRDTSSSPVPSTISRPSPQKPQRTYDNKLISRELDRIGMSHFQTASSSTLAAAASASTISLAPTGTTATDPRSTPLLGSTSASSIPSSSSDTPWSTLHVQVLPLFNGEALRTPIEELNGLVKKHIQAVLPMAPSKAIVTLQTDLVDLISTGMLNLYAKLVGIDDDKLIQRLIELWNFFWVQVLPYVEGVFLPLQTDPILKSLGRTPKGHRRNSSSSDLDIPVQTESHIDVRRLALLSFRDAIILPLYDKLRERLALTMKGEYDVNVGQSEEYQQPRLQQMLLVLGSNAVLVPPEEQSPGERATRHLLRIVRGSGHFSTSSSSTHTFIHNRQTSDGSARSRPGGGADVVLATLGSFAGAPGDRRGRIHLDPLRLQHTHAHAHGHPSDPLPEREHLQSSTSATFASRSGSGTVRAKPAPIRDRTKDRERDPLAWKKRRGGMFHSDSDFDSDEYDADGTGREDNDDDDDDDDDSDLGVPLGSTTPTLNSGGTHRAFGLGLTSIGPASRYSDVYGPPRWDVSQREREKEVLDHLRSPLVRESFDTPPGQTTSGSGFGAVPTRHMHHTEVVETESDTDDDYGQPVVRRMG